MEEPSVLDYVKSKLIPWRHAPLKIPEAGTQEENGIESEGDHGLDLAPAPIPQSPPSSLSEPAHQTASWPWRSLLALLLALAAQIALEPPGRLVTSAVALYSLAVILLAWAYWSGEWLPASIPVDERCPDPQTIHPAALALGVPLAILAFMAFGGDLFTTLNVLLWYLAVVLLMRAFWLDSPQSRQWFARLKAFLARPRWSLTISRWTLLLVAVAGIAVFYHTYRLNQVPPEMNSDHAEKLLDVYDVLHGQTRIFFPRNTGREAIQFYLTAAIATLLGTGISFTSLKIGTALATLLTLPYIYLLGKEVANRQVGLAAVAFAAVAYWPNVIARLALRFALYPLFVAPTLYYLIRGLRRSNRNDFILSGLMLGIGLHGYTPIRILPFVVVAAVAIYLVHRQSQGVRKETLLRLGILALIALVVFLPLLRYALDNPDMFAYRAFTRLGTIERPLPGPAWQIFLKNTWNAMLMFGWDNGEVWTVSIPHRPALDVVAAALVYLGMALLVFRYLRRRHWLDLFLLVSVPMLMLPSILSLAFPSENPVLSRTGGALVPVFILVGIALEGLLSAIRGSFGAAWGPRLAWGLGLLLFAWSASQSYDLVFNQYYQEYQLSAWNTSEMGQVIRDFTQADGNPDSAWVMGYPYWVDTRLVGFNAGYPAKDYAMFVDQLDTTKEQPGPKLFLIKPEDTEATQVLQQLYPQGWMRLYKSKVETKDFLMYFVPPEQQDQAGLHRQPSGLESGTSETLPGGHIP